MRRRLDGEIEYVGRLDSQVKIRGFRIEVGEITTVLYRYPGIREATVSLGRHNDDTCLVAYYVTSNGDVESSDLRRHLQQYLPPYMIPRFFIALPSLPLTVNGKLNHRALPDPQELVAPPSKRHSRAPRTTLEREVLEVWRKVLGHDLLGPDDNVFEHGAHSVLAVQARNHLQNLLGREIPVVLLFQYPTASALAAHFERVGDELGDDQQIVQQRAAQRRAASRQTAERRRTVRRGEP